MRFQAGSSTPLHLIGVELEKPGDDFGFVRVVRKDAKMAAFPVNPRPPRRKVRRVRSVRPTRLLGNMV